jgi:TolB protein
MVTGDLPESRSVFIADADGTDAHAVIEFALWPAISPEGSRIAYYRIKDEGLYIANIDGGAARKIVPGEVCCAQWSPDGKRLVYVQGKVGKLTVADAKIFLVNSDGTGKTEVIPGYSPGWAPDGNRLVYTACEANTTQCGLFTYDLRIGRPTMITRDDGKTPRWSPRGDKIVYPADSGQGHINLFSVNPDSSGKTQLTFGKGKEVQPAWSLDGNYVYYRSDQDGKLWGIFVMRADGSGQRLLINSVPADGERWPFETLSIGP